jgi:hypothetical protein
MLRYRQVHLDFHTSGEIPGIGAEFSKADFQRALKTGRVDSITVFSKCHHGYIYHDTKIGTRHPHLQKPLLNLMIEAAKEIDVKTPIYISAGLDEVMAFKKPEWVARSKDGKGFNPLHAGFKRMCFNTPYLDFLCAQIEEVATMFPSHGLFLDIIRSSVCWCDCCVRDMVAAGLDPRQDEDAAKFVSVVQKKYFERTTAAWKAKSPNTTIFHNAGHITKGNHKVMAYNSHLELESLPTGGWGYDHFPVSAKYTGTTGMDFLGMTGKFHTTWGEFGGFKRPPALNYECAAMVAFGAKCSVGDQLHPSGKMDDSTYRILGEAYARVEALEKIVDGARPVAPVAVLSIESLDAEGVGSHADVLPDEGACRILLEAQVPFEVIDTQADFSKYRLLILPDAILLAPALASKVNAFLAKGGRMIYSNRSGMDAEGKAFVVNTSMKALGESEWKPDYILPLEALKDPVVNTPFVAYEKAMRVNPGQGRVVAEAWKPYFNRAWNHFCSHQHTPFEKKADYPAAVHEGNTIYFAHPIFTLYRKVGQPLHKHLVVQALRLLLGGRLPIEGTLPSTARTSLMKKDGKMHLHLMHAVPMKRGESPHGGRVVEVIEDEIPLHGLEILLETDLKVKKVTSAPDGAAIPFKVLPDGRLSLAVDAVKTHRLLVLE